jgi:hypothetical protein
LDIIASLPGLSVLRPQVDTHQKLLGSGLRDRSSIRLHYELAAGPVYSIEIAE